MNEEEEYRLGFLDGEERRDDNNRKRDCITAWILATEFLLAVAASLWWRGRLREFLCDCVRFIKRCIIP